MFVDGKLLADGCDAEALPARRFLHVITNEFIEESMRENLKELGERRAVILKAYNRHNKAVEELYGRSNDGFGDPYGGGTGEPLPYIPPTQETESGFPGLDPPLGE